jgi:hypothetical protein
MTERRSDLLAIAILLLIAAAGCGGPAGQAGEDTAAQAGGTARTDPGEQAPGTAEEAPGTPGEAPG